MGSADKSKACGNVLVKPNQMTWVMMRKSIRVILGGLRIGILGVLVLFAARTAQAQFTFITNNSTITITRYNGAGGDVVIPATINGFPVTRIGYLAFGDLTNVTSVTIPNTVASIEQNVFWSCTSLTNLTIPESVASIGSGAFYHCRSLRQVTVPSSVTSIPDTAFMSCTSLTNVTIPESVTNIGSYAFNSCSSLRSVNLPHRDENRRRRVCILHKPDRLLDSSQRYRH
jgi:hypothetical protein